MGTQSWRRRFGARFYADDARVVSQSPQKPRKMMGVVVVMCVVFSPTLSEASTKIMCLRTKGMSESTAIFSVEVAGRVYNQINELVYLWVMSTTMPTCPSRSTGPYATHVAASVSTPELYDRPSAPLELNIRMLRVEVLEAMLYGCVTWGPRACHYDTPRRAHHSFLTRCIGLRKTNRIDHPIPYLGILIKAGSDSI